VTRLGDSFPEEHRAAYAGKALAPGHILRLWCDFTARPKFKYLVIVGTDPDPIGFFINSRVPAFIAKRPGLLACQLELSPTDYPFLRHVSYLDCRAVVDALDDEDILAQVTASPSRFVGELAEATKADVLRVIAAAPTISEAHRAVIRQALGPTGSAPSGATA